MFPIAANSMTSYWANASRHIALSEVAFQMASAIQQLYLSLSRIEVSAGTTVLTSSFPSEIASHPYTAAGALRTSSELNSTKILTLSLELDDTGGVATARTPLGPNTLWDEASLFHSWSPSASIRVQKFTNGTLLFSFG